MPTYITMLVHIGVLFLTHLIIPVAFMVRLSRGRSSKIDWLLNVLVVLSFILYLFLAGRWDWLSYYLRFILIALFFVAAFKSYIASRRLPSLPKNELKNWLSVGVNCFVLILFVAFNVQIVQGYFFDDQSVQLDFPLENGSYYVAHGGNNPVINYHNVDSAQAYALDIDKLNSLGTRAWGIYPKELEKYAIFGETITSPCSGEVQQAIDGFPDLTPPERDQEHLAGNYVMMACGGVDVILAHMKRGSVAVETGESLRAGQSIGQVSNSGNTSEPHLHIHVRQANREISLLEGDGVPMTFNGRFLVRNSVVN